MNRIFVLAALGISSLVAACAPVNDPDPNFAPGAYEPETAAASVEPSAPPSAQPQPSGTIGEPGVQGQPASDVAIGADSATYADTDPSALADFREPLEPYGTWNDDPTYGTYWSPNENIVGAGFVPYETAGHWTYDNDEYVWVSDYDWGYIPFHYGRWAYLENRGWGWIPGRVYSGAWVTWRTGAYGYGYIGWAPMAPSWYWWGGTAVAWGYPYYPRYNYCATEHLFAPALATHVVGGSRASMIEGSTRPYVPASPTVGRTVASPTVGGGARTTAQPGVGPSPHSLGISDSQIAHASVRDAGLARAQALASPATAQRFGAHAPMGYASTTPHTVAANSSRLTETRTLGGGQSQLPPSLRATASAPQYTSPTAGGASRPYYASAPHPQSFSRTESTTLGSSRGAYSASYPTRLPDRAPSYSRGEYRSPSSMSSSFRSSAASPSSAFHSPSSSSSSFHNPSTLSAASGGFHSSSSHSSGGHGGGGHGGGHR